jgi:hypothetical protein
LAVETPWDAANVALGIGSAVANIATGNYGAAAVDALGVVVDIAATATPGVPGGAAAGIKAARCAGQVGDAAKAVKITVQFGKNDNQVHHVFRHTDALGLDRSLVQSTVQNHLQAVSSKVVPGTPFNQTVNVSGINIQYTAFQISNGSFNVGRIHGIK